MKLGRSILKGKFGLVAAASIIAFSLVGCTDHEAERDILAVDILNDWPAIKTALESIDTNNNIDEKTNSIWDCFDAWGATFEALDATKSASKENNDDLENGINEYKKICAPFLK